MGLFGIKTKKDKQIEQLKNEMEWLKGQTLEPIYITEHRHITSLCAMYDLPEEVVSRFSQDHIKRILAREIADKIVDKIEVICDRDYMRRLVIYRARIDIVDKGE